MQSLPPTLSPESTDAPDQGEAQRLAEAFRIFNQASAELTSSYAALQGQVAQLTAELAAANGALRQQFLERAALAERLALLLDALPAGVVLVDEGGRVAQANPAAERLLGQTLAGLEWTRIAESFEHGDVAGEFRLAQHAVAIQQTALDSAGGRIVLLHDVTETHALKVQAARNQRLAAMGEMAAQLAHQLRTPLAAALLYAGNLEMPTLPEASRIPLAEKTLGRLRHLEKLIQDMLLFARGEVLGREAVPMVELFDDIRHVFEPLARQRQIDFSMAGASGDTLICNRKAIHSALTSLLENAFDALGPGGQVALRVVTGPDKAEFIIEDNGRGIAPEVMSRLFEPFYTTRSDGTGLGLAIARGVALAHGGGIDVSSSPGEGSRFVMRVARAVTGMNEHE